MGETTRRPRSGSGGWRSALWGALLVLGAPWGAVRAAEQGNPYILAAVRLYDASEYEEALRTLEKAAQWPSNTPQDQVSVALLQGILLLESQKDEQGLSAFRRALSLSPAARLPVPVSPKITEQLERVRQEF